MAAAPTTARRRSRHAVDRRTYPRRRRTSSSSASFKIPGVRRGQIADLAVHKGFAYLNSWDDPDCDRGGVYVVDIRDPATRRRSPTSRPKQPYYHGEGAHAISLDTPGFTGDILAVNDET